MALLGRSYRMHALLLAQNKIEAIEDIILPIGN